MMAAARMPTPVSGGGGAASGYDRHVTNARWPPDWSQKNPELLALNLVIPYCDPSSPSFAQKVGAADD